MSQVHVDAQIWNADKQKQRNSVLGPLQQSE